ncbi:cell wall hydrolase [Sphingomonas sanguinis]|uniref:SleB-like protein n=1 Tax=Sphingomonas sanguinis TaxID=33051 RepID=A0A147J2P9_9SPHN|nr:cell wall hydrolase [Sphingomonas sanguinis]KTW02962.1 SleB-like protein [Sphingomonas sanguinis]
MSTADRPRGGIRTALFAIAGTASVVPALLVANAPAIPKAHGAALERLRQAPRVVPPAELPPVEPVSFIDMTPDEARAYNEGVPFSTDPNPAARPFIYRGSPEDKARALDCLAAGVLYEAGDDAKGEQAVAQVVLNRLRHPAFPKTVCGVVFEGQKRPTGCQFTFSCDGALTKWQPPEAAWTRAREIATMALNGKVFRPVGHATHYHTDWVVPYWQASLDKVARVGSHLFFRWSGWWGTPPAFNRHLVPGEPVIEHLAPFSPAHRAGTDASDEAGAALAEGAVATGTMAPLASEPDTFLITLPAGLSPDGFPALATTLCGPRKHCTIMAWRDAATTASSVPLNQAQMETMAFSYFRDAGIGLERTLWNCGIYTAFKGPRCMKRTPLTTAPIATPTPQPSPTPTPTPTDELTGVRRASTTPAEAKPKTPPL